MATLTRSMTYAELVAAINSNLLNIGESIRITDYVTTTSQSDTVSAGHEFDLIVTALSTNQISENVTAIPHAGDTYFTGYGARLSAWDVKYTHLNDNTKYAWADPVNGKGVIYYLRDEWMNECHYDFKNILFTRTGSISGFPVPKTDNFFTFSWVDENNTVIDLSLIGNSLINAQGEYSGMFGNKIGRFSSSYPGYYQPIEVLSNNVFISTFGYGSRYFYGCFNNTFGNDNYNNTFGNNNYNNTFGDNNNDNTFGNDNIYITFGNNNYSNTFGNENYNNTFGNSNNNSTFGNDNYNNTFGNDNNNNNFGDISLRLNNFNHNINGSGINYSAATHLVANYQCDIFLRADSTPRLRYCNSSDVEVIVAVNS